MNLPEPPPTFAPPTPAERPWRWRLEDPAGASVTLPGALATAYDQRFPTRADAESWIGETWSEMSSAGVAQVTLFEGEREVYGPMSLSA
ncbi:hypothetical protein [Nocardioides sp. YIM 152588]|uniref:hypothetical protein n=1 Tax=Nocardioides sp. YIM 152588 TaxID=3158259 RepID=UPI0032E4D1A6